MVRRLRVRCARPLDFIAMFPVAVPGIVFGTGIFWTYLLTPVYGTVWVLVLAFIASYLPFAYRIGDTSSAADRPLAGGSLRPLRRLALAYRLARHASG